MSRPSLADKRRGFRQLHEQGCFVIPNPWDVGSARYLQSLGFKALASSSAGFAWSRGRGDNGMPREAVLGHLRELVEATDLPVNADFESGYANDAAGVAESVRLAVETGLAGLSIEDATGVKDDPLVADIAALGVRRISVGGAMAGAAWHGFMQAAKLLAEAGKFDGFAHAPGRELNPLFRAWGATPKT